jgi:Holliday junction DNA helicase RuvB
MNENLNPERDSLSNIDLELDKALRPKQFDDFSGQPKVVENLKVFVSAAKMRGEALDHVLYMVLQVWAKLHCLIL